MKKHTPPIISVDIVILGAGIAGYEAFRSLSNRLRRKRINKTILIIDKNNYFTFVPMLHEAATGSIEPTHCAIPLRELVHGTPHTFLKASVLSVHPEKSIVETSKGAVEFGTCIIALGSTNNYYNIPGANEHTYSVRTLEAAIKLKHDFISLLDNACKDTISVSVVGGGYTGVEVAGQYSDLVHHDLKKLYPEKQITVHLIQGADTILLGMSQKVQTTVYNKLKKDGVEIHLNSQVTAVTPTTIKLSDDSVIESDLTIWTAGFGNVGTCLLGDNYCERGRIVVNGHLQLPNHPNIYAIGDISLVKDPEHAIPSPQLAEAAHKQGEYVGKHLVARLRNRAIPFFSFKSKGTLMPVGDWYGVAEVGPFIFFGKFAWWLRRTVYVMFMPGIIRKLRIVIDWTLHTFSFRHFINTEESKEMKEATKRQQVTLSVDEPVQTKK